MDEPIQSLNNADNTFLKSDESSEVDLLESIPENESKLEEGPETPESNLRTSQSSEFTYTSLGSVKPDELDEQQTEQIKIENLPDENQIAQDELNEDKSDEEEDEDEDEVEEEDEKKTRFH